ncbi:MULTISPECIES: hypothetical protein [Pseudomonas]|uniref:hypothetical protein n=1 Tax=Pseudomonas TaxID=286 RepID=UPI001070F701|nr:MULTISPECIES: hypothetical protein [Pseudomonas]QBR31861.1 hypothetical protein E3Z29_15600 [Pseudomonas sp. S150]UZT95388.1 hypothetical protein OPS05_12715 [Pseudomonas koreensis]
MAIWFGLGYYELMIESKGVAMGQVTDQEVDDAIDVLMRFVRDFLDTSATNAPDVDEVRAAVRALVDANRFNPEDYEIKNLLRVSESKKGVSHVELHSHLKHLAPYEKERREMEKHWAIHGYPENEDPFSE